MRNLSMFYSKCVSVFFSIPYRPGSTKISEKIFSLQVALAGIKTFKLSLYIFLLVISSQTHQT